VTWQRHRTQASGSCHCQPMPLLGRLTFGRIASLIVTSADGHLMQLEYTLLPTQTVLPERALGLAWSANASWCAPQPAVLRTCFKSCFPPAGGSSYHALHACSSAPAGSNLFDKFDRVAQQHSTQPDQQHLQRGHPQPSQLLHASQTQQQQQQQQQHAAVAQAAPVVRARRLTARRGSWGGSEQLQR